MEIIIIIKSTEGTILADRVATTFSEAKNALDLLEMEQAKWESFKEQLERQDMEEFNK